MKNLRNQDQKTNGIDLQNDTCVYVSSINRW